MNNNNESTIDKFEVNKFSQIAKHWWDLQGPLKTLHDINPVRLDFINQYTNLKAAQVLDLGCGGGILCEAMAQQGAVVTGLDADTEVIRVAQEHAGANQLAIHYVASPVEDYHEGVFEVVTCMELLEHVANPSVVLHHCNRLIQPGGLLFLSTISRTAQAYVSAVLAAEYLLNIVPKQTHDYTKLIKPSELAAMARSCGFSLMGMSGLSYNPFSSKASLCSDVAVNYLAVFQKME